MPSVLAIIQSRLGSHRFPMKATTVVDGKPLIAHVVERVRQVRDAHVVLAVPVSDVPVYQRLDLGVDIGTSKSMNDDDVLGRFIAVAAQNQGPDAIMRVCGDCVLWEPDIAEHVIKAYLSWIGRFDYVSNVHSDYEDGTDVEVFSRRAMLQAHFATQHDDQTVEPNDREHVTPWIRRNLACLTLAPIRPSRGKTSIDTPEDLARVREWMQQP